MSDGPGRAYHLERDEEAADGLRRIARGRIEDALDELRGGDDFARSVHEARKDMKKLRAVLRLVREALGDELYRRENERFRDSARLLSGVRDAEVKLKTIDALREADQGTPTKTALRRYVYALGKERDESSEPNAGRRELVDRVVAELEAGEGALDDWPLSGDEWELVAGGLDRGYRRGRRLFAAVREDPSDENVHEWRKRVKDLWYFLRILRESWPAVVGEAADEAHGLSELLGDHHDLAVLAEDAEGRPDRFDSKADLDALVGAARRRQDELVATALGLGERLYAEKPKAFAKRYRAYWEAWRGA